VWLSKEAIMKCELLETTRQGQVLVATLFFNDGQIEGITERGNDILLKSVLADQVVVKGKIIRRDDDPEAWFRGLPHQYNGSYLRARIVE
jgi:hypothetical protein